MRTLDEAWDWYRKNQRLLRLMGRLGRRYWDKLPWEAIGNDEQFRSLTGEEVENDAGVILKEFDDIAIFVFFSVFEATVRDHLWGEVADEVSKLTHPALMKAAIRLRDNIEEGGFYLHVLDLYKDTDPDLVEGVNQVRKYRNWVAHGRRPEKTRSNTTPRVAYERLLAFLTHIGVGASLA